MLTEQNIRKLIADSYHQAALCENINMRLVAEILEHIREQVLVEDPYVAFRKLALNKDQYDKPRMRQVLLLLRRNYFSQMLENISIEINEAAKISKEAAGDVWWHHYSEALMHWAAMIHIPLTELDFDLPSALQQERVELRKLNQFILQSKWIDSYPYFERLTKNPNVKPLQQAYFHINLGKIELYYMSVYRNPLVHFEIAKELAGIQPWITRAFGEYYNKIGEFEKAREYVNSSICDDEREIENYLLMGDIYRDEKKLPLAEQWYFDAMNLNFIESEPLLKLAILYADPAMYEEKNQYIEKLIADAQFLDKENPYSNNLYHALKDLGNLSLGNQNIAESESFYKKAIALKPEWGSAHLEYAYALISLSRFDEAFAEIEKAKSADPESFDTEFALAWYYEKTEEKDKAIQHYEKCAAIRPIFADGFYNTMGVLYGELDDFDKSKECYQKAIDTFEKRSLYFSNLGYANRQLKLFAEAEIAYKQAIKLEPGIAEYHNSLGNVYYAQSRWMEAKECYQKAIEKNSFEPVYYENLGLATDNLQQYAETVEAYEKAIELRPCKENHNLLGIACYNLGENEKAVEHYLKAIESGGNDPVYYSNIALAHTNAGNRSAAISAYEKAILYDPTNYKYQNSLGNLHYEGEEYTEAIEHYRQAIALCPEDPVLYENLGLALEKLHRAPEAEEAFKAMLNLDRDNPKFHNRLGIFAYNQGRYIEAISHYEKAIELSPSTAIYYENLGLAYQDAEMLPNAREAFEKLIETDPSNPDNYFRLALVYVKEGRQNESIDLIAKGVSRDPENPGLLKLLGQYQEGGQMYREAIETYNRGLLTFTEEEYFNNRIGICYYTIGEYETAIPFYQKAIALNPGVATYHTNLGLCYVELTDYNNAIAAYARSVELEPARANNNFLGVAYFRNDDYENAIRCYKNALEYPQDDGLIYANLSLAYVKAYETELAELAMKEALVLEPGNTQYLVQIGALCIINRKYPDSVNWLTKSLQAGADRNLLSEYLTSAFTHQGDTEKVLTDFKAVLSNRPDSIELLSTIENLELYT